MRRLRMLGVALGSALVGASLVLVMAASFSSPRASAAAQTISVGAATVSVGGEGTVSLQALNMTAPGLGAWSMNIVYDPAIVQLVAQPNGCVAQSGSVCNPAFAANTIRVTGAAASGLAGNTTLATFTFHCSSVGTSALTVTVDTLADATPGSPHDIVAATSNGSVSCLTPSTAQPTPQPTTRPGSGPVPGFPAAGGTYVGQVPGKGTVTLVISPDGQGISSITVSNLVTVCGTINQAVTFDPPLDIQEPGFSTTLGAVSQGVAGVDIVGTFAENGTIPVQLTVLTTNVNFPSNASPCQSANIVFNLVLTRQGALPVPSGGPNAGFGPGGSGPGVLIWLVAGLAGAGLAAVTGSLPAAHAAAAGPAQAARG